ncbi:uncharacterized protein [Littorina saxatilis]|uniref:Uncharacterized protein n=3 Tax=Littorina saxatilis TaxID=31220 RepID=A0AAN9AP93_9CAEN
MESTAARRSSRRQSNATKINNSNDVTTPPPLPPPPQKSTPEGISAAGQRSRNFRAKVKADPERFEAYKKSERLRSKLRRLSMTPEEKEAYIKAGAERTKKCRAKKKDAGLPLNKKRPEPTTRAAVLKKREVERVRKANYRARVAENPYKKSWVDRKRRESYRKKKAALKEKESSQQSEAAVTQEVTSGGYKNKSSKLKALKKVKNVISPSPGKYADVVAALAQTKSPRKRKILDEKGVKAPSPRKKLFSDDVLHSVKEDLQRTSKKRTKVENARRRVLCGVFNRYSKHRGCASTLKAFGTTKKFVNQCAEKNGEWTRKKRKDAVPAHVVEKIQTIYEREDISRDDPCQKSVSARTGNSTRYMEKTLQESYDQYITECNPDTEKQVSFSKFAKLKPKDVKTTQHNKLKTCKCEHCEKVRLLLMGINNFLIKKNQRGLTLANKRAALDLTLCPKQGEFHNIACVERTCEHCGVRKLRDHLSTTLEAHADELTTWDAWTLTKEQYRKNDGTVKDTTKWKPIPKSGPFDELVTEMEEQMTKYSLHLFNADWQYKQFCHLRDNLPQRWLLTVSDFGQNFTCHHQDEIQGAHWARSECTIHPVVTYFHTDEGIRKESFVFLSTDLRHDAHASHHYQIDAVKQLLGRNLEFERIVHFSDGCASQYKGKTSFVDLSFSKEDTGILTERHYFGSRHGKGPCDAEIGTVKKNASLAVKRRTAVISDPSQLYQWGKQKLSGKLKTRPGQQIPGYRTFVFVGATTINRNRPERSGDNIKTLTGTQSLHSIRSVEEPYIVTWRKRTCFCGACRNINSADQCINEATCGPWTVFNMKKRTRRTVNRDRGAPVTPPEAEPVIPPDAQPVALPDAELEGPPDAEPAVAPVAEPVTTHEAEQVTLPDAEPIAAPVVKGDWVRVAFPLRNQRKAEYIGKVLDTDGAELEITFTRRKGRHWVFPAKEDRSWVDSGQIIAKLDHPSITGRDQYIFETQ